MARRRSRRPATGPSRQRKGGPGKFKSERQRRWMWKFHPRAAKRWAHYRKTSKSMWVGRSGGRRRRRS